VRFNNAFTLARQSLTCNFSLFCPFLPCLSLSPGNRFLSCLQALVCLSPVDKPTTVEVFNLFSASSDTPTKEQLQVTLPVVDRNTRVRLSFGGTLSGGEDDELACVPTTKSTRPPRTAPSLPELSKKIHPRTYDALLDCPLLIFANKRLNLIKQITATAVVGETRIPRVEAVHVVDEATKDTAAKHEEWRHQYGLQDIVTTQQQQLAVDGARIEGAAASAS
jgi:hypothetical protein